MHSCLTEISNLITLKLLLLSYMSDIRQVKRNKTEDTFKKYHASYVWIYREYLKIKKYVF